MTQVITPSVPTYSLPVTRRQNGRNGVVVGYTDVVDDVFTHTVLTCYRWNLDNRGYARRYVYQTGGRKIAIFLAHVIYQNYHGPIITGMMVDHIDRTPLNNIPSNLRQITYSESQANRGKFRRNTSGYVGVSWDKNALKWRAQVTVDRERIFLGYYSDPWEAAQTVNWAYEEYYPGIAIPNPVKIT